MGKPAGQVISEVYEDAQGISMFALALQNPPGQCPPGSPYFGGLQPKWCRVPSQGLLMLLHLPASLAVVPSRAGDQQQEEAARAWELMLTGEPGGVKTFP